MTRIELWNGDICDLEVDAIVSPAATSLWMSSGTAGEIKRAGGDEIEFAAVRQGPVALGEAVVTPAGRLAAKVVVHAVSMERDHRTSAAAIDRAARSAIARVRELGLASIAIPALGTGVGGFPLAEAASWRSTPSATSSGPHHRSSTSCSRSGAPRPTRRLPTHCRRPSRPPGDRSWRPPMAGRWPGLAGDPAPVLPRSGVRRSGPGSGQRPGVPGSGAQTRGDVS